jgi:hypothetical protein
MDSTVVNTVLFERTRAYVRAALDRLSGLVDAEPPPIDAGQHRWVPSGEDTFVRQAVSTPMWWLIFSHYQERLHSLPEYSSLLEAIRSDATVSRHLDVLVGDSFYGMPFETYHLTDAYVARVAEAAGAPVFSDSTFLQLYASVEQDVYDSNITRHAIAPLLGLKDVAGSIELSPDMSIDRMTDEELVAAIESGLQASTLHSSIVSVSARFGLRHRISQKKLIGDALTNPRVRGVPPISKLIETSARAVQTLRLFKRGTVSCPGLVMTSQNVFCGGGVMTVPISPTPFRVGPSTVTLDAAEGEQLCALWRSLDSDALAAHGFLETAIRRFSYGGERHRPEDRLIDLMIAAEALFLNGTGDAALRGEMGYRLALRFACFAETPGMTRQQHFDHMKVAYAARSAIVHGDTPKRFKMPDGSKATFPEFVDLTEDLLRSTLRKMVRHVQAEGAAPGRVDWEKLILSP